MFKHIRLLITILLASLALSTAAFAQGPLPRHSDPEWWATYWNNTSLSGTPALQRGEANINYDWGAGSPAGGINADGFSARWTRYVYLDAGNYQFTARSDDGVRIWVNDLLLIDDWSDHQARTVTANRSLETGHYLIKVEYYDSGGQATVNVSWTTAAPPIANWRGEYFNNTTLSGSPAVVRDDAHIQFDWRYDAPAGGIGADYFSVRWTRSPQFAAGNYRFTVTADDGVRLWVNNHLLIDQWGVGAARTHSGDIYLPAGASAIKLEYFEQTGLAVAKLSWSLAGTTPPATPPPVPPAAPAGAIVVDNTSPGFTIGGRAASWRTQPEGYGGSLLWTKNNDTDRANYNWGRWTPQLAPGRYEVFVFVPYRYTTTGGARYWISHRDGYTLRIVSQSATGNQWVSLGTYHFTGTSSDHVTLSDVTYEPYLSRLIAWDAVRWDPR